MFFNLLRSEWFKLRKTKIGLILFIGPLFGLLIGLPSDLFDEVPDTVNEWEVTLLGMNLVYALLFLPLVTGVLASFICRYEHQAGGWKQLLALPVTRGKVFFAKYTLIMLLVFVVQILYLVAISVVGTIKGFTDPFPMTIIWKSILGGWVATLPLVALQLWMSLIWKSFAAPFAVNVIFTLPAILAVNSERFGPFYPWAQPFSMMYVDDGAEGVFFVLWDQLLTVVGGSFILFFFGGWIYFRRKAV